MSAGRSADPVQKITDGAAVAAQSGNGMPLLKKATDELFCQLVVRGKSYSDAHAEIGLDGDGGNASRFANRKVILDRILEIRARGALRAEVTVANLLAELEEVRVEAMGAAQYAAATGAILGKAKIAGIAIERHEHTGKDGAPIQGINISALTNAQLDILIERIGAGLGLAAVAGGPEGREGTASPKPDSPLH